jgi:hypothetical protein
VWNWATCLLWASKTVFWASCLHVIINPIITWVSLLFSCSNSSENTLKVSRLCKHNLQFQSLLYFTLPTSHCSIMLAKTSHYQTQPLLMYQYTSVQREPCLWNCIEVWSIFGTNWHLKRSWENLEGRLSGPLGSLQSDASASLPCNPAWITLNAWRDIKIIASIFSSMLSLNVYLHHRIADDMQELELCISIHLYCINDTIIYWISILITKETPICYCKLYTHCCSK